MTAPNPEEFARFARNAGEGPVVMLNLLAFVPDGGRERYAEYLRQATPLVEKVGGSVVYLGEGAELLLGSEHDRWDEVLLVEYPTRHALLEMVQSTAYQQILPLRNESLLRSVLLALNPLAHRASQGTSS